MHLPSSVLLFYLTRRFPVPRFLFRVVVIGTLMIGGSACHNASICAMWNDRSNRSTNRATNAKTDARTQVLRESWAAYRQRFIQADGRIIDRQDTDRSISEGQAYALLRAVWIDDRATFDRVLQWSENNLRRIGPQQQPIDRLWAWKWGRASGDRWTILDANFATDADIDAIAALILAARKWNHTDYLTLAKAKLVDLWDHGTIATAQQRYLLPGPIEAFRSGDRVILNPSYFAPAAFRLFQQVDPQRDWNSLIDSSYRVLNQSAQLSNVGLPSDWIAIDPKTGEISKLPDSTLKPTPPSTSPSTSLSTSLSTSPSTSLSTSPSPSSSPSPSPSPQQSSPAIDGVDRLVSRYGFDASRVWWRVALDAEAFREPRAKTFLQQHLRYLVRLWKTQGKLPAQLDLQGRPIVSYDSASQYGMVYAALRSVNPTIAAEIETRKLSPQYRNGFWENDRAYYTQNLAWLGLVPTPWIVPYLTGVQDEG